MSLAHSAVSAPSPLLTNYREQPDDLFKSDPWFLCLKFSMTSTHSNSNTKPLLWPKRGPALPHNLSDLMSPSLPIVPSSPVGLLVVSPAQPPAQPLHLLFPLPGLCLTISNGTTSVRTFPNVPSKITVPRAVSSYSECCPPPHKTYTA